MFIISEILSTALESAGITPHALNLAYDRRVRTRMGPMVETDHLPRRISIAVGLAVHFVRRSNKRLLVTFGGHIRYTEFRRDRCELILPVELPITIGLAAPGLSVDRIVDLGRFGPLFGNLFVRERLDSWKGSTAFLVESRWKRCS